MLQDDDYKIRNTIDKLSNLTLSSSAGSKFTSWLQGLSTAFTTTARRTALQINTVIDKAFTPEPSPVAAPVQKTMDAKPYSVASPKLERQESFIVEPPTCDCSCDVPSAECEAPSAECDATATDADATATATAAVTATAVETHGTDSDSAIGAESGHQAKACDSEVAEAEKKEV